MNLEGCSALITGASSGIGREFARQLAPRARRLILVARRQKLLEQLRDELIAAHPRIKIDIRSVDLSDNIQLKSLTDWISTESVAIDFLINNAGLGDVGSVATADPQRLEQIVLVNMNALTLLTRAIIPRMIASRKGAILNVSSSAGFLPMAGFAVYAASKAYVTSFSEALRTELRGANVTVSALCPGPVHTEFTEVAHRARAEHFPAPEFVHVSVGHTARAGLAAIEQDRPIVIPGAIMKIAMTLARLTPMPLLRLFSRFSAKRT